MARAGLGRHPQDVLPDRLAAFEQCIDVLGHDWILLISDGPPKNDQAQRLPGGSRTIAQPSASHNIDNRRGFHRVPSSKLNGSKGDRARGSCRRSLLHEHRTISNHAAPLRDFP